MLAAMDALSHGAQAFILFFAFVAFLVAAGRSAFIEKAWTIALVSAGLMLWVFVYLWAQFARM